MTDKLKAYLKVEINNKILNICPNKNQEELENFFDSVYSFVAQLEEKSNIPDIALSNANRHFAQMEGDEEKMIFVKAVLLVLGQEKYSSWQYKTIYSKLKKLSIGFENHKFIKNFGDMLRPAIDILQEDLAKRGQERQTEKLISLIKSHQAKQEAKSEEIKLFQFNPKIKDVDNVIKLIHSSFVDNMYIEVDYKVFERHFFDNGTSFMQISWESEITKLKGFVDSLFNEGLIKRIKNSNVFITAHFTNYGKPISTRNLGNENAKKEYIEICHDKPIDHPIVKLVNKIKSEISQ